MDKEDVVLISNGTLLSHKKNKIMPFVATCIQLEVSSKWIKSERPIPPDITYLWNLKHDTNELIYEMETESGTYRTDAVVAQGEAAEGGVESEVGVSRWKLLYIGWINNKVLLYSTEKCI